MSNNNFAADLAAVASEFDGPHRKPRPSKRPYFRWTEEQIEQLVDLVDQQKTAEEIAVALCVPLDRVKSKLAALKAKVPSVKPSKTEPAAPEPEPSTEPVPEVSTEPIALDRVIFDAFCEFCGLVDNYEGTANGWRRALTLMESYLRDQFGTICGCPDTAKHFATIAAIIAYDELRA